MATPTGTMKTAQTPISQIVPQSAAWMPALVGADRAGSSVMKSEVERAGAVLDHVVEQDARAGAIARRRGRRAAAAGSRCPSCAASRGSLARSRAPCGAHSYTCRYLRTKRIEIRFMTSVITNSEHPDREDRLVRDAAGGDVALGGRGDEGGHRLHRLARVEPDWCCTWPAAISTIIVSPIARETPSTTAATMPDSAAGKTTRSRRSGASRRRARRRPRAATAAPPTSRPRRSTRSSGRS